MAALRWRSSSSSALSVARVRSRENSVSSVGGTTKISSASVTCSLTIWAPWTSILRIASRPASTASRTWSRGEPYQLPWTSFASSSWRAARSRRNSSRDHEVVVDAVDLARPRRAGRAGDDVVRTPGSCVALAHGVDDRVLAHARGPRDDDEHRPRVAVDDAVGPPGIVGDPSGSSGIPFEPGARGRQSSVIGRSRPRAAPRGRPPARPAASPSPGSARRCRGAVSSSRQACRNSRSRPSGPRRDVPVP